GSGGGEGLYWGMALTSPLRREILKGASTEELRDLAVKEGMLTLRMDGMVKVKKGITTLEEVVKETAAGQRRGRGACRSSVGRCAGRGGKRTRPPSTCGPASGRRCG